MVVRRHLALVEAEAASQLQAVYRHLRLVLPLFRLLSDLLVGNDIGCHALEGLREQGFDIVFLNGATN